MNIKQYIIYTLFAATMFLTAICGLGYVDLKSAKAETQNEYMRIITEDTPFYSDRTADSPLFYLPYTYYVRVKELGEIFTRVEYANGGAAIDGYVPTNKLYGDGLEVLNPFPNVKAITANTAVLYATAETTVILQYVFSGRELYYYGKYYSPQGKTLYYVGYNDRLGYVKEEDLIPFTLSFHPNELTFLTPEPTEEPTTINPPETTQSPQSVFNIRIAIFVVLGLAGLIALIFALRKKPKVSPAAGYYDENDYE